MPPDSEDGGHRPVSPQADLRVRGQAVLHVSKNTAGEKANTAFPQRSIYNYAPSPPPDPATRFRRALSRRWKLCVFTANAERRCLLGSWTPGVDDRNGETFLQAKILRLENHLFWAAEYDVERQAKHDRMHARSHARTLTDWLSL